MFSSFSQVLLPAEPGCRHASLRSGARPCKGARNTAPPRAALAQQATLTGMSGFCVEQQEFEVPSLLLKSGSRIDDFSSPSKRCAAVHRRLKSKRKQTASNAGHVGVRNHRHSPVAASPFARLEPAAAGHSAELDRYERSLLPARTPRSHILPHASVIVVTLQFRQKSRQLLTGKRYTVGESGDCVRV